MPMDGRLYRAAQRGDMEVLKEFADQLTTKLTSYKNTVLHTTADQKYINFSNSNNVENFTAIVSRDLLFCLNSKGDTCIHVAARKGHLNLIEALIGYLKQNCPAGLEGGIEPIHELLRIPNNKGNMALHEAVMYGSHRLVETLVKEDDNFTHPLNNASKSPLFLAMEKKDKVSAELILSNSSSPSYVGPYGTTALHAAAIYHVD
ncbi:uncharacterized protein LOC132060988 [Lycium ferocissimum]|uniref:uncharacterized protein LOC132060988 n=1 Tax=Lycium ferocissimum TaxID=112874 RepID=UPI0028156E8B|nr:uncharacterized protein LOC132060988 [Lycium ferocissimum]